MPMQYAKNSYAYKLYLANIGYLIRQGIPHSEAALVIREARVRTKGIAVVGKLNMTVYYVDDRWGQARIRNIPRKCRRFSKGCVYRCKKYRSGNIPLNCVHIGGDNNGTK